MFENSEINKSNWLERNLKTINKLKLNTVCICAPVHHYRIVFNNRKVEFYARTGKWYSKSKAGTGMHSLLRYLNYPEINNKG